MSAPRPSRVIATAGHVDHGKSTIVECLTGVHPDRLEEERRRGLTIDLGFSSTVLDSDIEIGIVDVPGHIRFLKNMVAGVGAVDACLFVVAATEGWKPQSEDHLRILDVLGVEQGTIVLTHVGLVDEERLGAARLDVTEHVAGTFLQGAPIVAADVPAGIGVDGPGGLRAAVSALAARLDPAPDRGRPRLWIDRSFVIRGAGTVVTGTLAGGALRVGERMEISSSVPGGALSVPVRVRGLESYGRPLEVANPGRRLAVNLAGADRGAIARGAALVRPGQWHRCHSADATLVVMPGVGHPVTKRGAYLAHIGTSEQAVRLQVIGAADDVAPGDTGFVRLWLSAPLPLAPGDRYVLRDAGRQLVVGGGVVLDVAPVLPVSRAHPTRSVARVVKEHGWLDAELACRLTGEDLEPNLGRWVVDPEELDRARGALESRVLAAGAAGLDLSLLDARDRALAGMVPSLVVSHGILRHRHVGPPDGSPDGPPEGADADLLEHPYLQALRREPFVPPPPDQVDRNDLRRLVRSGLVVETNGVWFAASALQDAARRIESLLARSRDGVRVSDVRDELGASRRYVLALLAHFDANGVTRRNGDFRLAGPALAGLASHDQRNGAPIGASGQGAPGRGNGRD